MRCSITIKEIENIIDKQGNCDPPKWSDFGRSKKIRDLGILIQKAFSEVKEIEKFTGTVDLALRIFISELLKERENDFSKTFEPKASNESGKVDEKEKDKREGVVSTENAEYSLTQESLTSMSKVDEELTDMMEETRKVTELNMKFEESFKQDENMIKELFDMGNTTYEITKILNEKENVIAKETSDECNQEKSITSGLIKFIQNLLEGKDCDVLELDNKTILTKDTKTMDQVKQAITVSLDYMYDKEAPLFEASLGNKDVIRQLIKLLSKEENSTSFTVIALLSAVNGRLIELLSKSRKRFLSLKRYFPDVADNKLPSTILHFIKDIQPSLETARKNNEKLFDIDCTQQNASSALNKFTDLSSTFLSGVEVNIRPLLKKNVKFESIPSAVARLLKSQTKNDQHFTENTALSQDEQQKLIKSLKKENTALSTKIREIEDENSKLSMFNRELEKSAATLREKVESIEIRLSLSQDSNRILKDTLKKREENFLKQTEQILSGERKRYAKEIESNEERFNKQREHLETKIEYLISKVEALKRGNKELAEIYGKTIAMQKADSKLGSSSLINLSEQTNQIDTALNMTQQLGTILDQCFTITGQWNNSKVTKAVQALVVKVHILEKEKKQRTK